MSSGELILYTQHTKVIYAEGEPTEAATCKELLQVRREGSRAVNRSLKHYNLDMILAIGYRVRSPRGTRFHQWAVTGHTAPELIADRADPALPNMGLTAWKGGQVRNQDVTVAKNYLSQDEIEALDSIVVMYLDYAEDQAQRRKTLTMNDWEDKLDAFLQFNEREVLTHAGKLRADVAEKLALERYESFDASRREAAKLATDAEDLAALEQAERALEGKGRRERK